VKGTQDVILAKDCYLVSAIKDWKKYLSEGEDDAVTNNIRKRTQSGWPCGDDVFVNEIENLLARKLSANPRGRPRKGK
jgi:hypothetical protein